MIEKLWHDATAYNGNKFRSFSCLILCTFNFFLSDDFLIWVYMELTHIFACWLLHHCSNNCNPQYKTLLNNFLYIGIYTNYNWYLYQLYNLKRFNSIRLDGKNIFNNLTTERENKSEPNPFLRSSLCYSYHLIFIM